MVLDEELTAIYQERWGHLGDIMKVYRDDEGNVDMYFRPHKAIDYISINLDLTREGSQATTLGS
jgi:hypothetical protein